MPSVDPIMNRRYNWYPKATETLENMKKEIETLPLIVTHQIKDIEELQNHANMNHDKEVQTNVDELVRNLFHGFQQINNELPTLYQQNKKLSSTYRRTYQQIEKKAIKAKRTFRKP